MTTDLVREVEGYPNPAGNYYAPPATGPVGYYSAGWNSEALRTGRTVATGHGGNIAKSLKD